MKRRGFLGALLLAPAVKRLLPAVMPPVDPPLDVGLRGLVDDGTELTTIVHACHTCSDECSAPCLARILTLTYNREEYFAPHERALSAFLDELDD